MAVEDPEHPDLTLEQLKVVQRGTSMSRFLVLAAAAQLQGGGGWDNPSTQSRIIRERFIGESLRANELGATGPPLRGKPASEKVSEREGFRVLFKGFYLELFRGFSEFF